MNDVQYKDFLLEKIQQINNLLIEIPSTKARFQGNIQAFRKKSNEYNDALKEHLEKARKKPKWKVYGDGKPPQKGWIWDGFYKVWRPKLGFCPEDWISHRYRWNPLGMFEEPEQPNMNERIMCEYALLANIHDEVGKVPKCDRLDDAESDDNSGCWVYPLTELGEINSGDEIRHRIQEALAHVHMEADLANLKAAEPDSQQGKFGFHPKAKEPNES